MTSAEAKSLGVLSAAVPTARKKVASARERAEGAAARIRSRQPAAVHEEVRLAMALNGGVSLAVWMGGVAVELDCARRAHLGPEPATTTSGERTIYSALCLAFDR